MGTVVREASFTVNGLHVNNNNSHMEATGSETACGLNNLVFALLRCIRHDYGQVRHDYGGNSRLDGWCGGSRAIELT
eukprot:jgi/Mesvir1/28237/Mv26209-RA.1